MNNSATGKVILQIEGLHCDVVAIPLAVSGLLHPVIADCYGHKFGYGSFKCEFIEET